MVRKGLSNDVIGDIPCAINEIFWKIPNFHILLHLFVEGVNIYQNASPTASGVYRYKMCWDTEYILLVQQRQHNVKYSHQTSTHRQGPIPIILHVLDLIFSTYFTYEVFSLDQVNQLHHSQLCSIGCTLYTTLCTHLVGYGLLNQIWTVAVIWPDWGLRRARSGWMSVKWTETHVPYDLVLNLVMNWEWGGVIGRHYSGQNTATIAIWLKNSSF